ncbi:hypothetical protein PHMEG_00035735 [Phytophthora megakarya]|uniref:RxLR effector protein n=1 Tax=Phytophthora megakarya TaxID=4795 RepID=A0A225UN02_9STRA|nr:hypothetical protein PHMEG_00035735 [Phytophthora megakarya]
MRFSYLVLILASALLVVSEVSAKQSTDAIASVGAATKPNLIDIENTKRFLRSHKRIEDEDSTENADEEERGAVAQLTIAEKLAHWLKRGYSPGMVRQDKLPKHGYSGTDLEKHGDKYASMHRIEYGLNNGQRFTE